jgi:hypothetical protein
MIEAGYFGIPSFFFANCTLWTNVSYILKSLNRYCNLLATAFSLPLTCPSSVATELSMNKLSHTYLFFVISLGLVARVESIGIPTLLLSQVHGSVGILQ